MDNMKKIIESENLINEKLKDNDRKNGKYGSSYT